MHMKKFISVLMALVMVFSVFAISANAWTGQDSNQSIKIVTTADKTTVKPGDTVTFTIKLYMSDASAFENAFGNTAISWMYNTAQITPTAQKYGTTFADWSSDRPVGKIVSANPLNLVKTSSTADEQARIEANGYDAICKLNTMKDTSTTFGSQGYWSITDDEVAHTLTCTIADNVTPGTKINFDMVSGLLAKNHIAFQFADTANNNKMAYKYGATYYDTTEGSVELTVASEAPAGPALAHQGRQVKMAVENGAVVSGTEQLRVVSAITPDDWKTYFANTTTTGATTNAIQEVGIVAFKGTAAAFDADTAKAVAQGTAAEGYSANSTDYIQNDTAGKTGMYLFGARIEYQSAVFDTTYLAYVKYLNADGQVAYAFYDTATIYSLNFAQDYTTITNGYIDWLGTQA